MIKANHRSGPNHPHARKTGLARHDIERPRFPDIHSPNVASGDVRGAQRLTLGSRVVAAPQQLTTENLQAR
jgi:hypothetical protein